MKGLLVVLISILFNSEVYAENLSNDPGATILSSFPCDLVGTRSNDVINTMNSLDDLRKRLDDKPECKSLISQLNTIPEIRSIIERMVADQNANAIREEEIKITEYLNDLDEISRMSEDDPRRGYYPSPEDIQHEINASRARIRELEVLLSIEAYHSERESTIQGVQEIDRFIQALGDIMESEDECLQASGARATILASMVGLAGFFIDEPTGTLTNLSGKVLQTAFNFLGSKGKRKKKNQLLEDFRKTNLVAGLTCSLNYIGKQRCRINRDYRAFRLIYPQESDPNQNSCEQMDQHLVVFSNQSRRNVESILSWVEKTKSFVGGDALYRHNESVINHAKSNILNISGEIRSSLDSLKLVPSDRRKDRQANNLESQLYTWDARIFDGDAMKDLFEDERELFIIKLISDPETAEEKLSQLKRGLQEAYVEYQRMLHLEEQGRWGGSREFDPSPHQNAPLEVILNSFRVPREREKTMERNEHIKTLPEALQNLWEKLRDPKALDYSLMNLKRLERKIEARLQVAATPEDQLTAVSGFFSNGGVFEQLKKLRESLDTLPPFSEMQLQLTQLENFKSELDTSIAAADSFQREFKRKGTRANISEFFQTVDDLVGKNDALTKKVSNLQKEIWNYYSENLDTLFPDKNTDDFKTALFYLNQSLLTGAIKITGNAAVLTSDYEFALQYNRNVLDGYEKFYQGYLEIAPDLARKMGPNIFSQLCMSYLSLPSLPKKVAGKKGVCRGAELKQNGAKIRFDDYASLPLEDRVCAFEDYLKRVERQSNRAQ